MADETSSLSAGAAPTDPKVPASSVASCMRRRALFVVGAASVIALAAGVAALPYCPWFARMTGLGFARASDVQHMQDRLSALDARVQALESRKDASAPQDGDVHPTSAPVPDPESVPEKDTGSSRLSALAAARMQTDIVALSAALAGMQGEVKRIGGAVESSRDAARGLLAMALSFSELRASADAGHPYANELAALRAAAQNGQGLDESLALLAAHAVAGAPSAAALREELAARAGDAVHAVDKASAQTWWQRVRAALRGLVSIRRQHESAEADALEGMQAALASGDAAKADLVFKTLPQPAQDTLGSWHDGLAARMDVDRALRILAARLSGERVAPFRAAPEPGSHDGTMPEHPAAQETP